MPIFFYIRKKMELNQLCIRKKILIEISKIFEKWLFLPRRSKSLLLKVCQLTEPAGT